MHLPQLRQLEVPLSMKLSKKNLLVIRFSRLSPMRAEIHWQKTPRARKGIIGSQPRGTRNVYTHFPKDPICEVCKKKTTRAKSGIKPKKRVDGGAFF